LQAAFSLTLYFTKYKQHQIQKLKLPPTKVLLQAGQTRRNISSCNAVQLQFRRDGTQVSSCGKHQQ